MTRIELSKTHFDELCALIASQGDINYSVGDADGHMTLTIPKEERRLFLHTNRTLVIQAKYVKVKFYVAKEERE